MKGMVELEKTWRRTVETLRGEKCGLAKYMKQMAWAGVRNDRSKIIVVERVDTDPPFAVSANSKDKKKISTEGGGTEFKANKMRWFLQNR